MASWRAPNPHRGKVGAIYVDPPHNTEEKDWRYNDVEVTTCTPQQVGGLPGAPPPAGERTVQP